MTTKKSEFNDALRKCLRNTVTQDKLYPREDSYSINFSMVANVTLKIEDRCKEKCFSKGTFIFTRMNGVMKTRYSVVVKINNKL